MKLLLAIAILLVFAVKNPHAHAQEVSYYLGNVIHIESRDRTYATAYIHTLSVSAGAIGARLGLPVQAVLVGFYAESRSIIEQSSNLIELA